MGQHVALRVLLMALLFALLLGVQAYKFYNTARANGSYNPVSGGLAAALESFIAGFKAGEIGAGDVGGGACAAVLDQHSRFYMNCDA